MHRPVLMRDGIKGGGEREKGEMSAADLAFGATQPCGEQKC
jgi:hypothetical protein